MGLSKGSLQQSRWPRSTRRRAHVMFAIHGPPPRRGYLVRSLVVDSVTPRLETRPDLGMTSLDGDKPIWELIFRGGSIPVNIA